MKKIAIQGIAGSFHHLAAKAYFGNDVEICPCNLFEEIPQSILQGKSQYGLMAIENSLAGSLLPNYMLIDEHNLTITGEINIPVRHALITLPGGKINDIQEVYSHPMALVQCKNFFKRYPHLKRIEFEDTALAAKTLSEKKWKNSAAIAPELAAELYELEILERNIQDHQTNMTRFVVLEKKDLNISLSQGNKVSFKVILKHQTGSLFGFLEILNKKRLNMTKIQSVPVFGKPWSYAFFIDALLDECQDRIDAVFDELKKVSEHFKILGIYPEYKKEKI